LSNDLIVSVLMLKFEKSLIKKRNAFGNIQQNALFLPLVNNPMAKEHLQMQMFLRCQDNQK